MVLSRGAQLRIRQPTTRLLTEFLISEFPNGGYQTNVPLGPTMDRLVQAFGEAHGTAASRPFRPKVDAIAFPPGRLVLLEAKEPVHAKGIGDLLFYRSLLPDTPELTVYAGRPVELWLVVPWATPALTVAAPRLGITLKVYRPTWYDQRMQDINSYWTADAVDAREEKKKLRASLGVE